MSELAPCSTGLQVVPHTQVHHALDTRRVILTIAACLSLIAGIVLVGLGAAAILPSLFGVIGGMILILFSSIALIYLYKKTREVDQIALEPLPEMISKDQSIIDFVKTRDYASLEKKATFAYTHTHYYDGSMVFYREIPRFMLGSYLALRKDMDRQALF
ncbi:hypothetical protein [Chlamydia pneumoniae]|uniref:Uncharacterized protein n=1 Tax=Chlamydia pneumoniae TaxID=83558 RepID=A0A0F7XUJ2_CHLPN|nr:hypothetical protein [Chlamydia pneumoniae]CRI52120.1 Uncharacterized protein BN1224_UZG1_B_02690 [Chlamydia pneumoniae]